MASPTLGSHQHTYDSIFQHPVSRNLQWRDVRSMLTALADLTEEAGENIKFTRNGQTLTVHPPKRKDFSGVEDLMQIRHFIERSNTSPSAAAAAGTHLLVVIDHREARVFKAELHGSVPERIVPFDPDGLHRHLRHVENDATGQRKPELKSFYEAIARVLRGAEKILIMGSSTGSSSAMDQLVVELEQHHPDLSRRIVGSIVVNEQHMTDDQLLAEARAFYVRSGAQILPA